MPTSIKRDDVTRSRRLHCVTAEVIVTFWANSKVGRREEETQKIRDSGRGCNWC